MRTQSTITLVAAILLGGTVLVSCGRDLKLESRRQMVADDLAQNYQVTILATSSGASSYIAVAKFTAGAGTVNEALPTEDSVTLNGAILPLADDGTAEYSAAGTANPGTFNFVWTHGDMTYKNSVTATLYPPTSAPATVSRSTGINIVVANTPADMTTSATVNAGTQVKAPYFVIPVQSGAAAGTGQTSAGFPGLAAGPAVVTILETQTSDLEAPTAAGGTEKVVVQFGYNVTVGD